MQIQKPRGSLRGGNATYGLSFAGITVTKQTAKIINQGVASLKGIDTPMSQLHTLPDKHIIREAKPLPLAPIDETKLETHYYDSYIASQIKGISDILEKSKEKEEERDNYFSQMRMMVNPQVMGIYDAIVNGSGKPENFFIVFADELLFVICKFIIDYNKKTVRREENSLSAEIRSSFVTQFRAQFNEQLENMSSGMCPQGRVNRLLQLLLGIEEVVRGDKICDSVLKSMSLIDRDENLKPGFHLSWIKQNIFMEGKKIKAILDYIRRYFWISMGRIISFNVVAEKTIEMVATQPVREENIEEQTKEIETQTEENSTNEEDKKENVDELLLKVAGSDFKFINEPQEIREELKIKWVEKLRYVTNYLSKTTEEKKHFEPSICDFDGWPNQLSIDNTRISTEEYVYLLLFSREMIETIPMNGKYLIDEKSYIVKRESFL